MAEHIFVQLSKRYPQLLLPIDDLTKESEEYKKTVLRGEKSDRQPEFSLSSNDELAVCSTPAGPVEVLTLEKRTDFEHCIQALAYRCEPRIIPASMGASTIRGLIDWGKIHKHKEEYLSKGGKNWHKEFQRFTSEKSNYLNCLIVLSGGYYSSVYPEDVGLSPDEWKEKSLTIRKYHELTHFVCRELYPTEVDAVRDEVIADMIGILAAFGQYDVRLARIFLGIESPAYRPGGRLENYLKGGDNLKEGAAKADRLIVEFSDLVAASMPDDALSLLSSTIMPYVLNAKNS